MAGLCNDVFFGLAVDRGAFGSIARHNNQLEVRIEFDLVLLSVLAFHVVNFIAVVCLLILPPVQPKPSMVALISTR